jgi:hypothetical protein
MPKHDDNGQRTGDPSRVMGAGADAVHVGLRSALEIVELGSEVLEEVLAGFDATARRGTRIVTKTVTSVTDRSRAGDTSDTASTSNSTGDGEQTTSADELVGQVLDLAQHMVRVATDAASRLLEVGVGPVERLVQPDSHRHDDARLTLGPARGGQRVSGTFTLENASDHPSEIVLVLTNPLASLRGTIPIDRVVFEPNPVRVPAHGTTDVEIRLKVPNSASAGQYLGIVRSDGVPDLSLILGVDVG